MKNLNKLFNRVKSIKNLEYILLTLVLLLGFLARLYKINSPIADWHSFRQADTASVSRYFVDNGIKLFVPSYHDISTTQSGIFNPEGYRFVEFPLFNALHALFYTALPVLSFEVWGRLVSVFSALVSTIFIFKIGKKFIGVYGGVMAALFYAFMPFNIYFTRVILPEPLAITLGLASVWFYIKFVESEKGGHLYFGSFLLALALLVKPYVFFFGIPVAYLLINKYGFKAIFTNKKLVFSGVFIFAPLFLWRVWMLQFPEGIPFWKWTFNGDGIRFKPAFWRWIFGERLGSLILGVWGLIPFSFGFLKFNKRYWFIYWFLLGAFFYVSLFATANVRHDYYQSVIVPPVSLALALGFIKMWKAQGFNFLVSRTLLVFATLMIFIIPAGTVRGFYAINRPEIIEAGKAVQELTPNDALVIAAYNGDTAFLYQTGRRGWPVVDRPIDEMIEKGAQYYVSVDLSHSQTVEFSERFDVIDKTDRYVIIKLNDANKFE